LLSLEKMTISEQHNDGERFYISYLFCGEASRCEQGRLFDRRRMTKKENRGGTINERKKEEVWDCLIVSRAPHELGTSAPNGGRHKGR